jgi:ribonuclease HI
VLAYLKWTVHFGWVKEHARIEGDELADRLAKEAAVGGRTSDIRRNTKRRDYNSRK